MRYSISACVCVLYVWSVTSCPTENGCTCYSGTSIHCRGRHINTIPSNLPSNTTRLELKKTVIISIESNKLQHLYDLIELRINYNNVQSIQIGAFDSLEKLTYLSLMMNNISVLPDGLFSKLQNLRTLILSSNKLISLENVLDGLHSLNKLDVSDNQIVSLTGDTFKNVGELATLYLARNNIATIDNQTFSNLPNLILLSLASNPLYTFDTDMTTHIRLKNLDLDKCNLTDFPSNIPSSIWRLSLSKNNIASISIAGASMFHDLWSLELDGNQLSHIDEEVMSRFDRMTHFYLSNNKVQNIPGPLPSGIKHLFLNHNSIHTILPESFQPLTTLETLSLKNNDIASVTQDSFRNVDSIEKLILDSNPISELRNYMFSNRTKVNMLYLRHLNLDVIQEECFNGLKGLSTLVMSYIEILPASIKGNIFRNTPNLKTLWIDNSPDLAHYILSDDEVMQSLSSLTILNLKNTRLTKLSSKILSLLPNLDRINIAGNRFICDPELSWLQAHIFKFTFPYETYCVDPTNEHRFMNMYYLKYNDTSTRSESYTVQTDTNSSAIWLRAIGFTDYILISMAYISRVVLL